MATACETHTWAWQGTGRVCTVCGRRWRIVTPARGQNAPLDTLYRRAWERSWRVGLTIGSDGPYELIVSTERQATGLRSVLVREPVRNRNVEYAAAELIQRLRNLRKIG